MWSKAAAGFRFGLGVGIAAGAVGGWIACASNADRIRVEARTIEPVAVDPVFHYGLPSRGASYIKRAGHILCYDQQRRTPAWVLERLTREDMGGPSKRQENFRPDPAVPEAFTATDQDYRRSGYSRGHMAAAANHKKSQNEMDETFYYSNIVPQDMSNNSSYWNLMEAYARSLTQTHSAVYVLSGPLWLPNQFEGVKAFVKYEVLGERQVAVPTHLFKVMLAEAEGGATRAIAAFVVPNRHIKTAQSLTEFQVPLDKLESMAGLAIFPALDRRSLSNLCRGRGSCNLKGLKDWEVLGHGFSLNRSRSKQQLDEAWREAQESGAASSQRLQHIYEETRVEVAAGG